MDTIKDFEANPHGLEVPEGEGWIEYRPVVSIFDKWVPGTWVNSVDEAHKAVLDMDGNEQSNDYFIEYRYVSSVERVPGYGVELTKTF